VPIAVYNRNVPRWIDLWLVQRNAYSDHFRLLNGIGIVLAVRSRRVHQSMAVLNIETVNGLLAVTYYEPQATSHFREGLAATLQSADAGYGRGPVETSRRIEASYASTRLALQSCIAALPRAARLCRVASVRAGLQEVQR
jgi:hypothetical protein